MVARDVKPDMITRWTTEIAELWPPQGQWTEADYFALPDTSKLIELSDGELIMTPPATNARCCWQVLWLLLNRYLRFKQFFA